MSKKAAFPVIAEFYHTYVFISIFNFFFIYFSFFMLFAHFLGKIPAPGRRGETNKCGAKIICLTKYSSKIKQKFLRKMSPNVLNN